MRGKTYRFGRLSNTHLAGPDPLPEEGRLPRVSKDEPTAGSSWFETPQGRLFPIRGKTYRFGRLSNTHLAAQNLILSSGVFAASRRTRPPPGPHGSRRRKGASSW